MPTGTKRPRHHSPALRTPSEHEGHLLAFFALHRIARPSDIMRSFPAFFKFHNVVIRHLNWLANQGYLRRYDYIDGYIYNITSLGYERCLDFNSIDFDRIPRRYDEPSGVQAQHELLITKVAVGIYEHVRASDGVKLLSEGRFCLNRVVWKDPITTLEVKPYAYLVPDYWYLCQDKEGWMIRYVEVISGEESATRVREKLEEYQRWSDRPEIKRWMVDIYRQLGAKNPRPEYQVHCIIESRSFKQSDSKKERLMMMQSFNVQPEMQLRVWTTTKERLEGAWAEGETVNHPIWYRAADFRGEPREQYMNQRRGSKTAYVDRLMRGAKPHPLFLG